MLSDCTNDQNGLRVFCFFFRTQQIHWVKSGNFGHMFANNEKPDETAPYEASHQDLDFLSS